MKVPKDQKCPICAGTGRQLIFKTRDRHYRIRGEWVVARCTGCGLVQLDPMPESAELLSLYPEDFYAYSGLALGKSGVVARVKRFLFPSLHVRDPHFDHPGSVLDSGCGTGWALLRFRESGWECAGVEPNAGAAEFGRLHYGLAVHPGTVLSVGFDAGKFDYIRANHSLEHDPVPGETLAEFRRILKPNGKLLIGVPNIGSWPARWFGKYWWYLGAPVHTYNFTVPHLCRLLRMHGFEVERIRYAGNFGGLIGSAQIFLNRNRPDRVSTDGWLIESVLMKVVGQGLAAILNLLRQGDAVEVVAHPSLAEQDGGRRC
jgi:SAM-dependent methyltransferase